MILSGIAQAPTQEKDSGKVTVTLYFRWDKAVHDDGYFSNKTAYDAFLSAINGIDPENVEYIDATTWTSPEGAEVRNKQLSIERMKYMRWLLRSRMPDLKDKVVVHSGGEAWGLLRERVQADRKITAASKERILRHIDNTTISNDTREWRLAHWLGTDENVGDLYEYLFRNHYRYLRNCKVEVMFKDNSDAAAFGVRAGASVREAESLPIAPTNTVAAQTPEQVGGDKAVVPGQAPKQVGGDKAVVPGSDRESRPKRKFVPTLGFSTNIPYDIAYIPNYGLTSIPSFSVEYYPANWDHWTFGADVEWPMWVNWDEHRFMQINNVTIWARRYFRKADERYKGLYLFGSANTARYGVGFDEHGWKGEGGGLSVGIGHKWMLTGRLYLDAGIAAGAFYAAFDSFTYGNDALDWYYFDYSGKPEDFQARSRRWLWFGPTRAYISLGIDLFNRNRR